MILMNGDIPAMYFSLDDYIIHVLNNNFLPFPLKDYICDTKLDKPEDMIQNGRHIDAVKDFLSGRVLNLSKTNAKEILNSAGLPSVLHTPERIKICIACRGLSMTDNFWLKEDGEQLSFSDVNLRAKHLRDAAFAVSVLGQVLSISKDALKPDIGTQGMFAKTWFRTEDKIELWKTDRTNGMVNTRAEIRVSEILDRTNIAHVHYRKVEKDGVYMAACDCLATDNVSLVSAQDVKDWCGHTGRDFMDYVLSINKQRFAQMVVADYLLSNTDRHLENFGFLVDNSTNKIIDIAPLYDHNQALVADILENDVSDLRYEPTGKQLKESAELFFADANITCDWDDCEKNGLFIFDDTKLPMKKRYEELCDRRLERDGKHIVINDIACKIKKTMLCEFSEHCRNGIYAYTQKIMAYNSNKIEGSTLTQEHTATLFDTGTICSEGDFVLRAKDVEEMTGHFKMFNEVLKSVGSELNIEMIKKLHFQLKSGVFEDYANGYPVGEFKSRANIVSDIVTESPANIPTRMDDLVRWYNESNKTLEDIAKFHAEYEHIHPFQDGNGRTGRAIILKQCLDSDIIPIIIRDDNKPEYYNALHTAQVDNNYAKLISFFQKEQERYHDDVVKFVIPITNCEITPLVSTDDQEEAFDESCTNSSQIANARNVSGQR